MNKDEIKSNGKLIMDFMGKKYIQWTYENRTSWISARKSLDCNVYKAFDGYSELKYHRSWSWLMGVVEKIEKLGYNIEIASYHPNKKLHWCCIHESIIDGFSNDVMNIVDPIESDNKIECVYDACIEFIKYYNKLNKQQ